MKPPFEKEILAAAALCLMFAACGDDSSSGNDEPENGIAEVATMDKLTHCTKSHYGELAYVAETDSVYECTGEGWVAADSSVAAELIDKGSSSDSQKTESSSSAEATSAETEKIDNKKVESVTVSGFAQKGPFESGSAVNVFGLDSALEKTSSKFTGKVDGDAGAFSVGGISLASQFALIEVSGYFQNIMTGKKSSGSKSKLSAIVDLSAGKEVMANVNLLTELEQARVAKLVNKDGFNVPAAKARATAELLKAFGFGLSLNSVPEKLQATETSLQSAGDVGAVIYALDVMLLGKRSIAKFAARLSDIEDDFAEDGSWDDAEIRAEVADELSEMDADDGFASVVANIKAMNLVSAVPNFQGVLNSFWTSEFGLPACGDSLETEVRKNENKNSGSYGRGYVCTSNRWHKATALDTELGLCTAKREGEFAEVKASGKGEDDMFYSCRAGTWNEISATAYELKSCTAERENEYVKAESGEMFACLGKQWMELDSVSYELKICTESREGEFAKTASGKYFRCENENWVGASAMDIEAGVVCKESLKNTVVKNSDGKFYACDGKSWSSASANDFAVGFLCTEKMQDTIVKTKSGEYYHCLAEKWTKVTSTDYSVGAVCLASNNGEKIEKDGKFYICGKDGWTSISKAEYNYGYCADENLNAVADSMACENGAWRKATDFEKWGGAVCNAGILAKDNNDWVMNEKRDAAVRCVDACASVPCSGISHKYEWEKVPANTFIVGEDCSESNEQKIVQDLICAWDESASAYDWRSVRLGEKETGKICNQSILDTVITLDLDNLKGFACVDTINGNQYGWVGDGGYDNRIMHKVCNERTLGWADYAYESYASNARYTLYVCNGKMWIHYYENELTYKVGGACLQKNLFEYKNGYVCDTLDGIEWRKASPVEKDAGRACSPENVNSTYQSHGMTFTCTKESDGKYYYTSTYADYRNDPYYASYGVKSIDSTVWMTKNMRYKPGNEDDRKCYLNDCTTQGGLYTWAVAQTVCPDGWKLQEFVYPERDIGNMDQVTYYDAKNGNWKDDRGFIMWSKSYSADKAYASTYGSGSWSFAILSKDDYYLPVRCVMKD